MFTHAKGLDAYWREASYNAINLTGSQVFGWYTLPQPRSFYVVGGHQDMAKTRQDCTAPPTPMCSSLSMPASP